MENGLYWVTAQSGTEKLTTIGICEDGKNIVPINPKHWDMQVSRVGPYIGDIEDAARLLTGNTVTYVPKPRLRVKQAEQVYYGA